MSRSSNRRTHGSGAAAQGAPREKKSRAYRGFPDSPQPEKGADLEPHLHAQIEGRYASSGRYASLEIRREKSEEHLHQTNMESKI